MTLRANLKVILIVAVSIFSIWTISKAIDYFLFKHINDYKGLIEHKLSLQVNRKISIGSIKARWNGLMPEIDLDDIVIYGSSKSRITKAIGIISPYALVSRSRLFSRLYIKDICAYVKLNADGSTSINGYVFNSEKENKNVLFNILHNEYIYRALMLSDSLYLYNNSLRITDLRHNKYNYKFDNIKLSLITYNRKKNIVLSVNQGTDSPLVIKAGIYVSDNNAIDLSDVSINVSNMDLYNLFKEINYKGNVVHLGTGNLRLLINIHDHKIINASSDISLLNSFYINDGKDTHLDNINLSFMLNKELNSNDYKLYIAKINISDHGKPMISNFRSRMILRAKYNYMPYVYELRSNYLDIAQIYNLSGKLLGKDIHEFRHISGIINTLEFEANNKDNINYTHASITVFIKALSVEGNLHSLDYFNNLDMYIHGTNGSGILDILNTNLNPISVKLHSYEDYKVASNSIISISNVSNGISWNINQQSLMFGLLNTKLLADKHNIILNGYGNINSWNSIYLYTGIAIDDENLSNIQPFLYKFFSLDLISTLDSLKLSAYLSNISILLKGNILNFPFKSHKDGIFKVSANLNINSLKYEPHCPVCSCIASLYIDDNSFKFHGRAKTSKLNVDEFNFVSNDIYDSNPEFNLTVRTNDELYNIKSFILDSSLIFKESLLDKLISYGVWRGRFNGLLKLNINKTVTLNTDLDFIDASILNTNGDVAATNVSGHMLIDNNGPYKFDVSGLLFEGLSKFQLRVHNNKISVYGHGCIKSETATKYFFGTKRMCSGNAKWVFKLDDNKFKLLSNLAMLNIELPSPLFKAPGKKAILSINGNYTDKILDVYGNYTDKILDVYGNYNKGIYFHKHDAASSDASYMHVWLNDNRRLHNYELRLPDDFKYLATIDLGIYRLNIDRWLDYLSKFNSDKKLITKAYSKPIRFRIGLGKAILFNNNIDKLSAVLLLRSMDNMHINVSSSRIDGTIYMHPFNNIDINLSKYYMESNKDSKVALDKIDKLKIHIGKFAYEGKDFNNLNLRMVKQDKDLWYIDDLSFENDYADLKGYASICSYNGIFTTSLNFSLYSKEVNNLIYWYGAKLSLFGALKTKASLYWRGSPFSVNLSNLNGYIRLNISKGFLESDNYSAYVRVLDILNIQSIPKRIFLDFKDAFNNGFYFNNMFAESSIHEGQISIHKANIVGSSLNIDINGRINLMNKSLDIDAYIKAKIENSFPVIGALLGHPILGILFWTTEKFIKQTSLVRDIYDYHYKVFGPWDNIIVKRQTKT